MIILITKLLLTFSLFFILSSLFMKKKKTKTSFKIQACMIIGYHVDQVHSNFN